MSAAQEDGAVSEHCSLPVVLLVSKSSSRQSTAGASRQQQRRVWGPGKVPWTPILYSLRDTGSAAGGRQLGLSSGGGRSGQEEERSSPVVETGRLPSQHPMLLWEVGTCPQGHAEGTGRVS